MKPISRRELTNADRLSDFFFIWMRELRWEDSLCEVLKAIQHFYFLARRWRGEIFGLAELRFDA